VGQFDFFVAAVCDRRLLIQLVPALIERRDSELTPYQISRLLDGGKKTR
jgi:hypothetical protein